MVKALAAGSMLIAAALPLAFASAAGAATPASLTGATVTYNLTADSGNGTETAATSFGSGASGEILIAGATGLAYDGGAASLTSNAAGLTFTSVTETSATTLTAAFVSTSATAAGLYNLSVTDDNGAGTATSNLITVNAAPTLSATIPVVPATLSDGAGAATTATVVTGTGFETNPTVVFTNSTNSTVLVSADTAAHAAANLVTDATPPGGATGASINVSGSATTALDVFVDPNNDFNASPAGAGTYTLTITNPDGGTFTSGSIYTVTAYGITNLTPSALPDDGATLTDTAITVAGNGFESGATFALTGCTGVTFNPTTIASVVNSSTSLTATVAYTTTSTSAPVIRCAASVTNPSVVNGGNAATYSLANAIGFGESSGVAATVTATTATTPIVPGAVTSAVTFTGTGFSQYSAVTVYAGTSGNVATGVAVNDCAGNSGTSLVCQVTVQATGAAAGADNIVVTNNGVASAPLVAGVSVAGPVITSMTPAAIAVGAPVGTTITLTGTGFSNTTTGTLTDNGISPGIAGLFTYVSATTMNLVLTASPVALNASTPADVPVVTLFQTVAAGVTVSSAPFDLTVDAAPTITGPVTYLAAAGVGVGATAQTIYIHGTNFKTGVTVGSFVNGAGAADANVVATVTAVNTAGTQITATIAIAAGDNNIADGYSVTNTDGGVAKATAILDPLVIDVGPTVTGVTPAAATASGTTAFTIAGTNFETGVTVSASSDGTCGTATVVSSTSLTVSCTLGAATATPVTLIVSNPDGGSAISAAVLTAAAPAPTGPHASGVHGSAVIGKTVTITISGTGFYGQPHISSTDKGTTAKVSHDSGTLLTVKITAKGGKGEHTLTITLADGKSCRVNYATKA